MNPRRSRIPLIASLLAALCVGAGGGALLYSAFGSNGGTTTVVRQVSVKDTQPASASQSPLSVNAIYRNNYQGVVEITVTTNSSGGFGGSGAQKAQGSGFVYDADGHIATNAHVVEGASSIKVTFWNGKTYNASLVGSDPTSDLAVIKVDAPASVIKPLQVGDSSALQVGDGVVAIGSPFGLQETVTSGIVSALHRSISSLTNFTIPDAIQTDAAINHGNSGGPLLNTAGQVVGINSQIAGDSGGNEGVGFAIPSNAVRSVVSQLISSGKAEHPYLGVSIDSTASNALLAGVRPGTPAAKAGLQKGDVVTAMGGHTISTPDELASAVSSFKPGESVSLTYERNGQSHTVQVKLATRPS
ncbi:MAG TPA: trypsin-like peptidase domain-containing protein [Gaiellaceae bacterium]